MQIFAKTLKGRANVLDVDPSSIVASLKADLQEKEVNFLDQQRLILAAKQLQDGRELCGSLGVR